MKAAGGDPAALAAIAAEHGALPEQAADDGKKKFDEAGTYNYCTVWFLLYVMQRTTRMLKLNM